MKTFEAIATIEQWYRDRKISLKDYDLRLQAVYAGYPSDAIRCDSEHILATG